MLEGCLAEPINVQPRDETMYIQHWRVTTPETSDTALLQVTMDCVCNWGKYTTYTPYLVGHQASTRHSYYDMFLVRSKQWAIDSRGVIYYRGDIIAAYKGGGCPPRPGIPPRRRQTLSSGNAAVSPAAAPGRHPGTPQSSTGPRSCHTLADPLQNGMIRCLHGAPWIVPSYKAVEEQLAV